MKKIRKFDEEMQEIYKKEMMDSEMVAVLYAVLGALAVLIPFYDGEKMLWVVLGSVILLLTNSVNFFLRPYLVIEGESIYQKMQFMPVTKREIRAIRMVYLKKRCKILFIIGLILHQIFPLFNGTFGIRSVLEIVVVYFVVFFCGVLQIYVTK